MTTQPQPAALRLADALLEPVVLDKHSMQAAAELRRLHAECEALRMERDALRAATGGRMGYFDDEVGKLHAECEALLSCLFVIASEARAIDAARAAKEQSNG